MTSGPYLILATERENTMEYIGKGLAILVALFIAASGWLIECTIVVWVGLLVLTYMGWLP